MRYLIAAILIPFALLAQVQNIPNTTFPAVRSMMNGNFLWLNTNKAGISACPANQYAIQTTTAGVVCASLTSGQLTTALGFTPENPANKGQNGGYLGIASDGSVTIGASLPAGAPTGSVAAAAVYSPGSYAGAFRPLMAALTDNRSAALQVLSDSTAVMAGNWVSLLTQWLGSRYPAYTVNYLLWNDTNQAYDATNIQTGAAGERYIRCTTSGATVAAGDFSMPTGDMDVRVKIQPDSWRPASTATIVSKWAGGGGQWSFIFGLYSDGELYWNWTADGSTIVSKSSGTAVPSNAGEIWVRVVHDIDNGAAGNDVKFYTSPDAVTWTQLGTTKTTAGTTSVFGSTSNYDIGAWGGAAQPLVGNWYQVEIRGGIGGTIVNPQGPDAWHAYDDTLATFGGAPVLTVLNGSLAGAGLTYLGDGTRLPKLALPYSQLLTLVSVSHNEGYFIGPTEMAAYATFIANVKAKLPLARTVILTQNPRTAPTYAIREHAIRREHLIAMAQERGYGLVDTYGAFLLDGRSLVGGDGIHPTATGFSVWAAAMEAAMLADLPR